MTKNFEEFFCAPFWILHVRHYARPEEAAHSRLILSNFLFHVPYVPGVPFSISGTKGHKGRCL
jgi:hypothetical protein